jgi:predicted acyl esterase
MSRTADLGEASFAVWYVPLVLIPVVTDGSRKLAASLWLPIERRPSDGASPSSPRRGTLEEYENFHSTGGAPPRHALFEHIPYRRADGTANRDAMRHVYLCAFGGYACCRTDLAGSGDSEGILKDEYLQEHELDDARAVIDWLATQPWSSGRVGMFGKSWGAFNSAMLASMKPPALKAVQCVAGTDDRYGEDVHYLGGCVQMDGMLPWASVMLGYNAMPPDPSSIVAQEPNAPIDVRVNAWLARWKERVIGSPHFAEAWLFHQWRDGYWRHGSVCENNYDALLSSGIPVLATGGWADGYTSLPFRIVAAEDKYRQSSTENVHHQRRRCYGIVGPWSHNYCEKVLPRPPIPFLQESVEWWRAWLDDDATSAYHPRFAGTPPPALRIYVLDAHSPDRALHIVNNRPGRWIALPHATTQTLEGLTCSSSSVVAQNLPSEITQRVELALERSRANRDGMSVDVNLNHGGGMGSWWGLGQDGEAPGDQVRDDSHALTFDFPIAEVIALSSAPDATALDLVGVPVARLRVSSSDTEGHCAVRLCLVERCLETRGAGATDVWRDYSSTLLSWGVLNLCHAGRRADGQIATHEHPLPLDPDTPVNVSIALRPLAYRIPPCAGNGTPPREFFLRIAIAPCLFPMIWPTARDVTLTLHNGSQFDLEVLQPRHDAYQEKFCAPLDAAVHAPPLAMLELEPPKYERAVKRGSELTDPVQVSVRDYGGKTKFDGTTGITTSDTVTVRHAAMSAKDVTSVETACTHTIEMEIDARQWRRAGESEGALTASDVLPKRLFIDTRSKLSCDATSFVVTATVRVVIIHDDGRSDLVGEREHSLSVPRLI